MATLIKNGIIINEGLSFRGSLLIEGSIIKSIIRDGEALPNAELTIDASNQYIIPGIIDDQVHFREPGNTHKGEIETESRAAVLGGVTSFMDMPNNNPPATSVAALEEKFSIASERSYCNYSFYLGASNDNIDEIKKSNTGNICGVKVFMGSSTGNMLVDNAESLENIFNNSPLTIATHCEEEEIIRENTQIAISKYGENIPFEEHKNIRSREACIASTKKAVDLAIRNKTKLHILHISTKDEVEIIKKAKEINPKISGETCVHYLIFDSSMYHKMGSHIKCNPSIKEREDKEAIINALKEQVISVVATDHAPHTIEEKSNTYLKAPSGLPLVQHSLQIMWSLKEQGAFSAEQIVEWMCHSPAKIFGIKNRGFIREGYFADITVIDPNRTYTVNKANIAYKCGWSPFDGTTFACSISNTIVNGVLVVKDGEITGNKHSLPLIINN